MKVYKATATQIWVKSCLLQTDIMFCGTSTYAPIKLKSIHIIGGEDLIDKLQKWSPQMITKECLKEELK